MVKVFLNAKIKLLTPSIRGQIWFDYSVTFIHYIYFHLIHLHDIIQLWPVNNSGIYKYVSCHCECLAVNRSSVHLRCIGWKANSLGITSHIGFFSKTLFSDWKPVWVTYANSEDLFRRHITNQISLDNLISADTICLGELCPPTKGDILVSVRIPSVSASVSALAWQILVLEPVDGIPPNLREYIIGTSLRGD